jgi:hypothetical protein
MNKEIRALISQVNAQKSTGPRTPAGRQRASMNAVKHNLTGSHLILQPGELEAWDRLTTALLTQLQPMTELERQAVAKIIDTHFRLNRLACVENNVFNFGLLDNTTDAPNEDRLEVLIAQTRAWIERSGSFDVLGRYEARLTKQVLQFTRELEHPQEARRRRESADSWRQRVEKETDNLEFGSFGKTVPEPETSHEMQA